ncbi:MAG: tRNA pseudouridine(55) synthase TruB [Chitinophagales bacterium]
MDKELGINLWEGAMLLVDKPATWTSFDVVNKIRYALKLPKKKLKVGHAGTLDPLATGLLIICTGKFTKKINDLQGLDKVYDGIIHLGATTPSYDAETAVDETFDITSLSNADIEKCAASFIGSQEQIPPAHSAVKIDGQRAYKLAREGQTVEMKKRTIELYDFKILNITLPEVHFEVHCSKGTYIRSLAYDFGRRLNNGGYLQSLRRTKIGDFDLKDAWQLDELIDYINDQKELLFDYKRR